MNAPALRSRDFRLLAGGQLVSLTGTRMNQVAVAWQLYELTHSPLSLGMLGFFRLLPVVVFGLGGGVVADAVDRRRLMFWSQTAMALASATLAVATFTRHVSPFTIYAVAVLSGIGNSFDVPARNALIPQLVPRDHLANALSLHSLAFQTASVLGPALGGVVLAHFGVTAVYLLDVASFGAVIVALALMSHRELPGARTGKLNVSALADALRFLRGSPLILSSMLLDFTATLLGGSMLLMPIFADQLLHTGRAGLGWLYAADPIGAVVAAALLATRARPRHAGRVMLASVAVYGASILVFGLSPWLPLSLFALACSGAADTVSMVIRQTMRQELTPDAMRGRVTSLNMIFVRGGPQLGEMEAGLVAKGFGPRASVASGGLAAILATGVAAILVPALRAYRVEPEPAEAVE